MDRDRVSYFSKALISENRHCITQWGMWTFLAARCHSTPVPIAREWHSSLCHTPYMYKWSPGFNCDLGVTEQATGKVIAPAIVSVFCVCCECSYSQIVQVMWLIANQLNPVFPLNFELCVLCRSMQHRLLRPAVSVVSNMDIYYFLVWYPHWGSESGARLVLSYSAGRYQEYTITIYWHK